MASLKTPERFEILATMGPACHEPAVIQRMIRAGATGFRFPFAKETPEWQVEHASLVAKIAADESRPVRVLMDLPGSQPRTSNDAPRNVNAGEILKFVSCLDNSAGDDTVGVPEHFLATACKQAVVIVGDGELALEILDCTPFSATVRSLMPGKLRQHARIAIMGGNSSTSCISDRDRKYINLIASAPFTGVLLSFVRSPEEVLLARKLLERSAEDVGSMSICLKIETQEAVTNIADLAPLAEEILVARGDLAIQTGMVEFYASQREVIVQSKKASIPVLVGTQLIESAGRWMPNRAELSDLSALLEAGIAGVLLSAETTIGDDPVRAVEVVSQLSGRYGSIR